MHGIDGGLVGRLVAAVKLALHGFYDYNGVIDHGTDDQYERKESQQIDGEAHEAQEGESTHQRHDDRDGGYDGGAHILEKDIHDQYDEQDSLNQRAYNLGDRGV